MQFIIYIIVSILIIALLLFVIITLSKSNKKLKSNVKELKETNTFLIEQQKAMKKKEEEINEKISGFHDSDGNYDIDAANDFLQELSEGKF